MQIRNNKSGRYEKGLDNIKCASCGKLFHPRNYKIRTCSKKCGYKFRTINSPVTKKTLEKMSMAMKKVERTKEWKDKISKASIGNNNGTGNLGKIKLNMRGKNHPNWKGGIGRHDRNRKRVEYKNWRRSVFKKDNYTCVNCSKGGRIVAHHIKEWCNYPELRYNTNNGITLCTECHIGFHHFFGNGQGKNRLKK